MASFGARRRKGGIYYSVYFTVDGIQFERSAGKDRNFAKRWAARLTEHELRRKAGFPEMDGPFVSTWGLSDLRRRDLEEARLSGRETKSRARRWNTIEAQLLGNLMLHEVTGPVAEGFRLSRLREAKGATVNRDLSVLSAAWSLAIRHGEAADNPWKRLPRSAEKAARRKAIALDEEASAKLIRLAWERAAKAHSARDGWQSASIVEIMFLTASRLSQVLRLRKDQLVGTDLVFEPQKGGTERFFDLEGETDAERRLAELVREAARRSVSAKWVFPSSRGRGKPRENIRRFWTALLKDAGIAALRRHDLRHSANTLAAYRGETIPELQARLGHASPRLASEIYTHVHRRRILPIQPSGSGAERTAGNPRKGANDGSEKARDYASKRVAGKRHQSS